MFPWKYAYPYHLGSKYGDVGVVIVPNTESPVLKDITSGVTHSRFFISCRVLKLLTLDGNSDNIFFMKNIPNFSAIAFRSLYISFLMNI